MMTENTEEAEMQSLDAAKEHGDVEKNLDDTRTKLEDTVTKPDDDRTKLKDTTTEITDTAKKLNTIVELPSQRRKKLFESIIDELQDNDNDGECPSIVMGSSDEDSLDDLDTSTNKSRKRTTSNRRNSLVSVSLFQSSESSLDFTDAKEKSNAFEHFETATLCVAGVTIFVLSIFLLLLYFFFLEESQDK
mmetsp:Transcript_4217/g.4624  ORF Transcript_4217/g.4624 Transcript_4217/m.4624 type:complete len:190 (-) Transcript_4217:150-719(-)